MSAGLSIADLLEQTNRDLAGPMPVCLESFTRQELIVLVRRLLGES